MKESGGRRIKRALFINAASIKFVDPDMRERFVVPVTGRLPGIAAKEIDAFNKQKVDTSVLINGRRMTNIGVFRHYVENYLRNHKDIRKDMSLMVRQLSIEDRGVPIEIYCFTKTTV